jgi:polyisoprenoid-binding protein YceI
MIRRLVVALATSLLLAVSASAQVETWKIDPNHTASQFAIRHMSISTVRGQFNKTTGTVIYDPKDPSKTAIDVVIDAASVNTRIDARDNDLRSPNYFDVQKFPTLTFKSKRAEAAGPGKLKVTGDLTIHGVTKEVVLDVDGPSEPLKDPKGNLHLGASATTKINRKDFGVGSAPPAMLGEEVNITIDAELIKPTAPAQ